MHYPKAIQRLIEAFAKLPTVGPKTAERFALSLLAQSEKDVAELSQAIATLQENITKCQSCFAITEASPCPVCADQRRQNGQLCIVSDQRDYLAIESSRQFQGRFYVLGAELNQLEGIGPSSLNLEPLLKRLQSGEIQEVILALNPTIEGETTSMYLAKLLRPLPVKVTRLARGLPMGANLEYVDELTLGNALKYRNQI
ncbi:recombination protein RecR [Candidatus Falkowbacteria bacterium]|nr:recombination protein RecR [Candidatus Falkowbacteria bacterium]